MWLKYEFFPKGGRGFSTKPKVLRHFLFALKQSKANKCKCAKKLKTVVKKKIETVLSLLAHWHLFAKQKVPPPPLWKKLIFEPHFLSGKLPCNRETPKLA